MQLIQLEAQGFKKLRRFTADFTEGLNVIVGDNAQGKSTLLQAIECALYGASVVPGKKEHLVTWGQKSWKLALTFDHDGCRYVVTRSKSTARLERIGDGSEDYKIELVANGNTPVTKAIEELLGLNAKDYNLFMQSKQGETSGVLTFGATALNRKVEEFAGVSLIDEVQDLAMGEARAFRAAWSAAEVDPQDLEDAQELAAKRKERYFECEAEVQDAEAALAELSDQPELEAPTADPDKMRRLQRQAARLESELKVAHTEYRANLESREEALQRFEQAQKPDDPAALKADEKCAKEEVAKLQQSLRDLEAEKAGIRRARDHYEALAEQLRPLRSPDAIREDLNAAESEVAKFKEQLSQAQVEVASVRQRITTLRSLRDDAECPTCGTTLGEHDPKKLAEEIEAAGVERTEHQNRKKEAQELLDEAQKAEQSLIRELEKRQDIGRQAQVAERALGEIRDLTDVGLLVDEVSEQLHHARSYQADVQRRLEAVESVAEAYERLQSKAERAERRLKASRLEVADLEEQLEELGDVPTDDQIQAATEAVEAYQAEKQRRSQALAAGRHRLEMATERRQAASEQCRSADEALQRLKEQVEEAKDAEKRADKASRLARFLAERRSGYLQEVWDAVLGAASKQVAMASGGMVTRLVYDDGDFLFEEEGILAPVASASGAQKAHIGVALRIGLSRALYGTSSTLIFDEPTESMREHHAQGLAASLAGAAAQCLLITHREQDQDLAANVIEVAA